MSDQFGKHDATGPLARRPDGTTDPGGYVKSRLRDRRNLAFHALPLIGWGVIWGARLGGGLTFSLRLLAGFVVLDVAVVYALTVVAGRREQRRRGAGYPPSWPAVLLAVLQAREAGLDIPLGIRNDSSVRGRLAREGDRWIWVCKPTRSRPDIPPVVLPVGWSATLHDKLGYRRVLTFADHDGAQLDFGIGSRRDLLRHLQSNQ